MSQGMMRGSRDEVADMQRTQVQQSETRSEPQHNQCLSLELQRTSSTLLEFFLSLVEPYRLDEEASENSASVDSGANSVDIE